MCTRAVSTLAHVFEAAGLASVVLASNREQARRIAPPRALFCDFPLGRPLGAPRDPALQRRRRLQQWQLPSPNPQHLALSLLWWSAN